MSRSLAERGAELLGGMLAQVRTLSGGSLSSIRRITLEDGREAIVKSGPDPAAEAAMLAAITASGAPAPAVLAHDDAALVIAPLPDDGSLEDAWGDLGAALARLHASTGESYGWDRDYAFGSVQIPNGRCDDWPAFWGERRLLVHVPHVHADLGRRLSVLAADLGNRLPARPRPALLHGDLWAGNVLASGGTVSGLIDPACYHGHTEVDLAMLSLFGTPAPAFAQAYGALEPGAAERAPIYALWPALVHLRLFGQGYREMVEGLLEAAGL